MDRIKCPHPITAGYSDSLYKRSLCAKVYEPRHEVSNNVVCATSKASDKPAHSHSLIRAFASRLNII